MESALRMTGVEQQRSGIPCRGLFLTFPIWQGANRSCIGKRPGRKDGEGFRMGDGNSYKIVAVENSASKVVDKGENM
ncbi:hypothetical protein R1flu_015436 [Riccia fluitans]|uniref:Uncharacterized protein n=1 Tax=Riccia fluitans TaxID=41844 RepID=A0ABD1YJC5_9MARC